jgi:hypothetical protein
LKLSKTWTVSFHDAFDPEFDAFSKDVQDELLAVVGAVKRLGPAADRPHVGTLENPRHPNMKELRFKANNGTEIWRAAFAFDPDRDAIILVAADKQGVDEEKFYKNLLKKANKRFDQHLDNMKSAPTARLAGKQAKNVLRKK